MRYFKHINPAAGASDFWSAFKQPTPYRWPILALSMLASFGMFYAIGHETFYAPPERPNVTYITTYAPGRSDAEIAAEGKEHQRWKDARAAELAEREERRKELYRALGRATGIDVDEMEREIAAQEAEEGATKAEVNGAAANSPLALQGGQTANEAGEPVAPAPGDSAAPNPAANSQNAPKR